MDDDVWAGGAGVKYNFIRCTFTIRCICVATAADDDDDAWTTDMAHILHVFFFHILFTPHPNTNFPYEEEN